MGADGGVSPQLSWKMLEGATNWTIREALTSEQGLHPEWDWESIPQGGCVRQGPEIWNSLSELEGVQRVWIKMGLENPRDPDRDAPTYSTTRLGLCPDTDF